ncbi:unnamed protein product, partial [Ectocarpus sp. 4 AP-2014]
ARLALYAACSASDSLFSTASCIHGYTGRSIVAGILEVGDKIHEYRVQTTTMCNSPASPPSFNLAGILLFWQQLTSAWNNGGAALTRGNGGVERSFFKTAAKWIPRGHAVDFVTSTRLSTSPALA